jgi:hypothetical protein
MSVYSLIDDIKNICTAPDGIVDVADAERRIQAEFDACKDMKERGFIIAVFTTLMYHQVAQCKNPADAEIIRDVSKKQYRLMLIQESVVGSHVDPRLIRLVTDREVAAGRMTEDDEVRKLAVAGDAVLTPKPKEESGIVKGFRSLFKKR